VSFAFGTVQITYTQQAATGSGSATPAAGWDIRGNVPLGGS
jgi:hypothetical protein